MVDVVFRQASRSPRERLFQQASRSPRGLACPSPRRRIQAYRAKHTCFNMSETYDRLGLKHLQVPCIPTNTGECAVDDIVVPDTDTGTVLWARHYSFPYTLLVMDRQQIINYQDFWLL